LDCELFPPCPNRRPAAMCPALQYFRPAISNAVVNLSFRPGQRHCGGREFRIYAHCRENRPGHRVGRNHAPRRAYRLRHRADAREGQISRHCTLQLCRRRYHWTCRRRSAGRRSMEMDLLPQSSHRWCGATHHDFLPKASLQEGAHVEERTRARRLARQFAVYCFDVLATPWSHYRWCSVPMGLVESHRSIGTGRNWLACLPRFRINMVQGTYCTGQPLQQPHSSSQFIFKAFATHRQ
jgi:hypothetical protein